MTGGQGIAVGVGLGVWLLALIRLVLEPYRVTGEQQRLERAIDQAASLHPSLHKRLLDMRFDARRCLAIEAAMHRET